MDEWNGQRLEKGWPQLQLDSAPYTGRYAYFSNGDTDHSNTRGKGLSIYPLLLTHGSFSDTSGMESITPLDLIEKLPTGDSILDPAGRLHDVGKGKGPDLSSND